ncbi:hypothetical protein QUF55_04440 [Clostridiaceae bacterium HSG29]|nr:hypothetical protein [Clostridiaceae bacterium HSG29]
MGKKELHLFILWEKSRYCQSEIIEDIKNNFKILEIVEVIWDYDKFSENLTRFYGVSLPKNSKKERRCGIGPFLLIIIQDENPVYAIRKTTKGPRIVNINMFDSKEMYRSWTGATDLIHATNDEVETNHDLTLLKGLNTSDYMSKNSEFDGEIKKNKCNLIGANGWNDLNELFYVLNSTIEYVVLRNFEPLPDEYHIENHGDIDILTTNYENMKYITNSNDFYHDGKRVNNIVMINDIPVQFDFRYVCDGYYDSKWEYEMIKNRIYDRGFYHMDYYNYYYSLIYHAVVHKKDIAEDYKVRIDTMKSKINTDLTVNKDKNYLITELKEFMSSKGYSFTFPKDYSVFFNKSVIRVNIPLSKIFYKYVSLNLFRLRRVLNVYNEKN